ncbi:hypothetical protein OIU79_026224 [Salix purpurea]|uniref:Uncharacterized protein n=1 Tax=Salix purpurea TaxID=77065 RepID=A0A9Q0VRC7_SALPP|nr:hypothetical protein OIU79_026224 [Salix purpurea]
MLHFEHTIASLLHHFFSVELAKTTYF